MSAVIRATMARIGVIAASAVTVCCLSAATAHAALLQPGSFSVTTTSNQAGAHPDVTASFAFVANSEGAVSEHVKDIALDLPAGFVGEPAGVPECALSTFSSDIATDNESCPAGTQVGTATLKLALAPGFTPTVQSPVYNITPDTGQVARFAFSVFGTYGIQLIASLRPGDYGIRTIDRNTSSLIDVDSISVTLWGVPADPSHDPQRGEWCLNTACSQGGLSAGTSPVPFLTNPTQCNGPLTASLHVDSWENPATFDADGNPDFNDPNWESATSMLPAITGCDRLSFQPTLSVQPTETTADSPTGLAVDLKVPQDNDPDGLATAELRRAVVTLPPGLTLSPAAADGLADCTDAEVGLGSNSPPGCPLASTIGTATLTTPALPDQLTGDIYLAGPDSGPITGPPYGVFVTLSGDGVMIKLQGSVAPNPVTGQLTATFDNDPQQPFSDLTLDFKTGSRAPLTTPDACGTYTTTSDLEPWSAPDSGADATPSDSFTIDSGCVSGFAPSFTAGAENAEAGRYSPFSISLQRSDTDQNFSGLSVQLPEGLLARLAGVSQCSDAQLAAAAAATGTAESASPSCPANSQVGTVTAGSGAGPTPFFLSGKAYLTGPYKGAPYGLAIVVPAVAGPFDLGTVVVRQSLFIDPETTQVTDVSDPFPTILEGIPLDIKRIDVDLNRPNFMVNPTSCDPSAVTGALSSTGGLSESVSSRFQVGGCQDIGFSPKLAIALTGKGKTRSGAHPTLTATLTDQAGQANIKTAKVALPLSLALDPNNSQHVCAFATAKAVHGGAVGCPASTIVGSASVITPLLSQPLTGKVYLVQGIRTNKQGQQIKTLPSLLIPLRGQIALDLRAQTSVSGGKLVTTFSSIPDAPVSKFTLKLTGGKKGILVITGRGQSVCQKAQVSNADLGAQSGETTTRKMTLSTPCGTPAKVRVLSRSVNGRVLTLAVKTSERGRLTVTGKGLKGFSEMLRAGTHHLRVAVKPAALRASAGSRALKAKVQVHLMPANARAATATFKVSL